MNNLFNLVLTNSSSDLTIASAILTLLVAALFGAVIAFTYWKTQGEKAQQSMAVTLFMLPAILSMIILFVGSNVASAFSLAGTLSIIRFRSAPGDPKDIGFIFFDIAAGLSCGVGLYGYGAVFVLILSALIVLTEKMGMFAPKTIRKILKITIPEDLNYEGAFDDILKKYTKDYTLVRIKTTDLGSLFELCFHVTMQEQQNERELLNELRCRNGNLSIILSVSPQNTI